MTLLRELINIPEQVRDGDFVLKLAEGVTEDAAAATIESYEVTDQLATAFDQALGLIASSVRDGESAATYLHGSFGAGKSHFMAVLHLLLQGHPAARAKRELHEVIDRHDAALDGKRFLLVPVHFLDARSMEQKILGGYVDRVAQLRPDAPVPGVFLGDVIIATELPGLRSRLGEEAFLNALNGTGAGDEAWGEFASTWTTASVDEALGGPATSAERLALVAAYVAAFRQATATEAFSTGEGYVDLSNGLAAIATHAQTLGYDAIVLFLDELILWLASNIGDLGLVQGEAQKLTNLVEGGVAHRAVPIVSFVARQRDLRELVGDHIAGSAQLSFADTLTLQSGRFGEIVLEARNLPVIARRRILKPVSPAADQQLRDAVEEALRGRDDVRSVLLGSDADIELFRTVYPFSPALVYALIDVAEALQRERTALKVMLQLLVDHRDDLELGQIIPVGDLWDVVSARDEPFARELRGLFEMAKRLYRTKLRPMLLTEHGLTDDGPREDPRWGTFAGDDRLLKTVLMAALVPEVEAFRNLDAGRLAALNWGSISTPIPRSETRVVVTKLNNWASKVGELKVGDDPVNPTVAIALVDVDTDEIIARAKESYDNLGARRRAMRQLIDDLLENRLGDDLTTTYKYVWRGTERAVDVTFGNIRDPNEVSDAMLRAGGGRPKVVIDFPFDEAGHTPEEDLDRLDTWTAANESTPTICWLPSFLNHEGLAGLSRFVAIDELLKGERFEQNTQHLSQRQRLDLRPVLTALRDQLRSQLRQAVLVAYGVLGGDHQWVDAGSALTDHFRALDSSLVVRPTTSPGLAGAFDELCDQLFAFQYPGHPQFDTKVTPTMRQVTWEEVQRALSASDGRVSVETSRRGALRTIATGLDLGTMGESHFVLSRTWANRIDRYLDAAQREGRQLTVGDVRALLDELDGGPRGLPPEIADLVVLTVAAQCDHSLSDGGLPVVPAPNRSALPSAAILRPERLPSQEVWTRAVGIAGHVLGIAAGANVSGPEVGKLGDEVAAKVTALRPHAQQLVDELDGSYRRAGCSDGHRRSTARATLALLDALRGASGHDAVETLADFEAPTSETAAGRSLSSAEAVGTSLRETNWHLLLNAGDAIKERLIELLQADELALAWDAGRRDLEADATRAVVQPGPTPGPGPGRAPANARSHIVRSSAELDNAIGEIRSAVDGGAAVEVTWRTLDADGS